MIITLLLTGRDSAHWLGSSLTLNLIANMSNGTNGHSVLEIPSIERYAGFEDVYIDEVNQLTVKDLFSLHPTSGSGWLTSSVIDSYLSTLTRSCPGNICFIKSAAATLIANNLTPKDKPYDALSLAFVKKMAFPILLRSHWVLVVVDHHNKKVMKYDPAGNESFLNDVERNIIVWYGNQKMSRFSKEALRETIDDGLDEDFVDRTGRDGGIWILYEVWKIARDDIAVHKRPSPYALRMRLFLELINGSIFEDPDLHLEQLSQGMNKLDRIVRSSARLISNGISLNSATNSDQADQSTQTDELTIKCSITDLLRFQHLDDPVIYHANEIVLYPCHTISRMASRRTGRVNGTCEDD